MKPNHTTAGRSNCGTGMGTRTNTKRNAINNNLGFAVETSKKNTMKRKSVLRDVVNQWEILGVRYQPESRLYS